MNKLCQNCNADFEITPDDESFYQKIDVPPPTFCPTCRFERRLSFCAERYLYGNTCSLCGKKIISTHDTGSEYPVYCLDCYRSDNWDPISYGKDYDFSKPFFQQFRELKARVPRAERTIQGDQAGNEFCNRASYNKGCYLIIRANYNENSSYSYNLWESRDCMDCFNVHQSELVFGSIDAFECYGSKYLQECRQCRDSFFLFDCRNCSNCIGCASLLNKQYCIFNEQYSKEDYEIKLRDFHLNTAMGVEKMRARFKKFAMNYPRRSTVAINCTNSSGNWLTNCNDVSNSYQLRDVEHGKNLLSIIEGKDCMDYSYWGRNAELVYETANCGYNLSNIRFVNESWESCHDLTYCDNCYSSSYLFGCVGLKNKQYCILNKQYSKEEYEKLLPEIRKHMDDMPFLSFGKTYKFGEFFPPEASFLPYNISAAQDYFYLSKDEALKRGYVWKEIKDKDYVPTKSWEDLPEEISTVTDDILKEIIQCETWDDKDNPNMKERCNCTKAFRIVPQELQFYRRMNIPLPRKCSNCRYFSRLMQRNPLKLWKRNCAKCSAEIMTSYAPERPEVIYCEQCYQNEIS